MSTRIYAYTSARTHNTHARTAPISIWYEEERSRSCLQKSTAHANPSRDDVLEEGNDKGETRWSTAGNIVVRKDLSGRYQWTVIAFAPRENNSVSPSVERHCQDKTFP